MDCNNLKTHITWHW